MSYTSTNYSTIINGSTVELGQFNNQTSSIDVDIVPLDTYTNTTKIVSFQGKTVVNQSDILVGIDNNASAVGPQTYTFGPRKRGLWVAGGLATGTTGQLAYSYDGISWAQADSSGGLSSTCNAVAWNGTLWVAGGQSTASASGLAYSFDGTNWNATTSNGGLLVACNCVAWNGTMWVAGGIASSNSSVVIHLAYSYDGMNWTPATSGGLLSALCNCVAWNGTMWVAGGRPNSGGTLAYSYDGINWTGAQSNGGLVYACNTVAWNGTMWIAGGQDTNTTGKLAYSTDGITWTATTTNGGLSTTCKTIAWNGTMWVAGGQDMSTPGKLAYSYNGINWTASPTNGGLVYACNTIAWNGTMWVAGGQDMSTSGKFAYSYNGFDWVLSPTTGGLSTSCKSLAWNGTNSHTVTIPGPLRVAVLSNGKIVYSYDGITWLNTIMPTSTLTTLYSVKYNGRMWVAVGDGILYSYNGIDWKSNVVTPSSITLSFKGLDCNETMWIATVYTATLTNTLIYSYDGINWSYTGKSTNGGLITPISIKWNGKMWVAGGESLNSAYSYDGLNWNPCIGPSGYAFYFIEWNGTMWLGGGFPDSSSLFISYDGINWTTVTNNAGELYTSEPNSVSRDGTRWIMSLGANTITSTDGINWVQNTSETTISFIKFDGTQWLGGGANVIKYSPDGKNWTNTSSSITGTVQSFETTAKFPYNVSITPPIVACGNNITAISPNGLNWNRIYDASFTEIASNPNGLLYIGASSNPINTLSYSYDSYNWVGLGKTIFATRCNRVKCNGKIWVAVGQGTNTIAYSYNGINWTGLGSTIFNDYGNDVEWNGKLWVVVGKNTPVTYKTIATSPDGIIWTIRDGLDYAVFRITWNGFQWILVGTGMNHFGTSTDGTSWSLNKTNNPFRNVYPTGVASNENIVVAVGPRENGLTGTAGNTIAVSTNNGTSFTGLGVSIFSTQGTDVVWNGKMFIATGSGGNNMAVSSNGTNWTGLGTTINVGASSSLSVLNNGLMMDANGIIGTQTLEINSGPYYNNTNNIHINAQGVSVRKP